MFGLPSQVQLANWLVGNYRQRAVLPVLPGRFPRELEADLNLGLRWEYATPRWERDNVLSNFDPATNTMIKAKNGSLYDRTLVNPDYKDWAPRLGFAYTIDSEDRVPRRIRHQLRAPEPRWAAPTSSGINGPQVVIGTINQTPLLANGQPNPAFITTQSGFPAASPARRTSIR